MLERKTVGQLMEEMRLKAGAQNYHGHEYMDLQRFAEDTRHMIIFDVLTDDSPVGWKGERTRLFLTAVSYTHLDVYKRQKLLWMAGAAKRHYSTGSIKSGSFRSLCEKNCLHRRKPDPVSYTHLDVYKRQRFWRKITTVFRK